MTAALPLCSSLMDRRSDSRRSANGCGSRYVSRATDKPNQLRHRGRGDDMRNSQSGCRLSPLRACNRLAAAVLLAPLRSYRGLRTRISFVAMWCFAYATSMGTISRKRGRCRRKHADKQNYQQPAGSQTLHGSGGPHTTQAEYLLRA